METNTSTWGTSLGPGEVLRVLGQVSCQKLSSSTKSARGILGEASWRGGWTEGHPKNMQGRFKTSCADSSPPVAIAPCSNPPTSCSLEPQPFPVRYSSISWLSLENDPRSPHCRLFLFSLGLASMGATAPSPGMTLTVTVLPTSPASAARRGFGATVSRALWRPPAGMSLPATFVSPTLGEI